MSDSKHLEPAVSVVVLNFNGADILARCLDHLLAQTYSNFEIIVVDNDSRDGSRSVIESYRSDPRVHAVYSPGNVGVPGGRNLGLRRARGAIVAFMDNDGYPRPHWLENAIRLLDEDPTTGAVASVVFFNGNKVVLNGAGGTLNLSGYGGDHCFRSPLEFASFPDDVLYPMGCGMVVRKTVLDRVGEWDEEIFNYYDDVELGIRVWNAGYRVRVAPEAWVDHDWGSSDAINRNKMYLCERNRVRTVLKYFPLRHLPRFLLHEVALRRYLSIPGLRSIPFRAWAWNLARLPSTWRWRRRVAIDPARYWGLIAHTWRQYPSPLPEEQRTSADIVRAGSNFQLDGRSDPPHLLYGWFGVEADGGRYFRWSAPHASALLRTDQPASRLALTYRNPRPDQRTKISIRPFGSLDTVAVLYLDTVGHWTDGSFDCALPRGLWEVLVESAPTETDRSGRELGVGVVRLAAS